MLAASPALVCVCCNEDTWHLLLLLLLLLLPLLPQLRAGNYTACCHVPHLLGKRMLR
jgi:hypothetical protein